MGFIAGGVYFSLIWPQRLLERRHKADKAQRLQQKKEMLQKGFPRAYREYLSRMWVLYRSLPMKSRSVLHKKIIEFITEKEFRGKRGLKVTEEMKLLIAAQACILVLAKPDCFPHLYKIEVFPELLSDNVAGNSSMSNYREGVIRLAWDAVEPGARLRSDSYNVVIHECAHQLDQVDLKADGLPVLTPAQRTAGWGDSFKQEFHAFLADPNESAIIADYGKQDMAEFFACTTESFFERPEQLRRHYKTTYELLKDFYNLDPATLYNQPKS